jgi:hypothetical protein
VCGKGLEGAKKKSQSKEEDSMGSEGTAERMGYIWGRRGQAQAGTTVQAGMLGGRDWLRGRARAGAVAANFAQPLTSSTKAAPSSDKEVKDGATSHQAWPRKTGALLIVLI